ISVGGDSDTIAAITGAVAGAYYGVPEDIREKAETFLDVHLLETLHAFERNAVK
ncbi:MAG: ADP-ribosylglycohydrolase family protein, partial [Kiritimatiellae bacterium]|nr:ADP-ribosylglycohydrolase family protein [Kiritimatiellia bacterium]